VTNPSKGIRVCDWNGETRMTIAEMPQKNTKATDIQKAKNFFVPFALHSVRIIHLGEELSCS
jgi:hypothetical protein